MVATTLVVTCGITMARNIKKIILFKTLDQVKYTSVQGLYETYMLKSYHLRLLV